MGSAVYASDASGDAFHCDIEVTRGGIVVSDSEEVDRFAVHVRWNVEGYGYQFLIADNGGAYYKLPEGGIRRLNLNHELARTRVRRNEKRLKKFRTDGWRPSPELKAFREVSREYLEEADKVKSDEETCARLAQKALLYALLASHLLELEKARFRITRNHRRPDFLFGCDSRSYFQMDPTLFFERFTELFNFATVTHYLRGDAVDFEPEEGHKNYAQRDKLVRELVRRNLRVEGRPLFWTHAWVTPGWLEAKSYSDLLKYVENHVREVVGHYGDQIYVWEVVNELHDWANELELDHGQTVELTKLACRTARETNPHVKLLINNCCLFADYVQRGKWHERRAKFPMRTPHQFIRELVEDGVDFDIIGAQMYFSKRPFADAVQMVERFKEFGKPVHIAEVGSPSSGITQEFIDPDVPDISVVPYEWLRHWDEELQADWLEAAFTFAYSRPYIEAANWYDFADPHTFLKKGGLLRSPEGEKKAAADRLLALREKWQAAPSQ